MRHTVCECWREPRYLAIFSINSSRLFRTVESARHGGVAPNVFHFICIVPHE